MYCTKCGNELKESDRFCSGCGSRTGAAAAPAPDRTLVLDKSNKKIAGVCAGFARYFDMDLTLMRVLWLAVAITTGIGFLAYLAAWMIMPARYFPEPAEALNSQPHAV